ncbi:MAG: GAF and ANTAR domain-containing protein [Candidatus Nanopelagicales bacterium]
MADHGTAGGGERAAVLRAIVASVAVDDARLSGTAGELDRIVRTAAREMSASGATLTLMSEGGPTGIVGSTDGQAADGEELQFILGEGPTWDAYESGLPCLAAGLGDGADPRWPGYALAANARGIRGAFAFPLQVRRARLGTLGIQRAVPEDLSAGEVADALTLAGLATTAILDGQGVAGAGHTPSGLDVPLEPRFTLYQAQGMVMVQLGAPLKEAMARLRAHAYAHDRTLGAVARDIVARLLVLQRDEW